MEIWGRRLGTTHAHGAAALRILIALERRSLALGALTVRGGGALFRDFLARQARCPLSAISVATTRPFRLDVLAFRARTVRPARLVRGERGLYPIIHNNNTQIIIPKAYVAVQLMSNYNVYTFS